MVCRPGITFNMQGVLQVTAELPSSAAVAPAGSLVTSTVCGPMDGAARAAFRTGFSRGAFVGTSGDCSSGFVSPGGTAAVSWAEVWSGLRSMDWESAGLVSAGLVSTGLVSDGGVCGSAFAAVGADCMALGLVVSGVGAGEAAGGAAVSGALEDDCSGAALERPMLNPP